MAIVELISFDAGFPTPFGLETRPIFSESLIFSLPFNIGFILNIAMILALWKRPRIGSLLMISFGLLFPLGVVLDQAGLVVPGQLPPIGVTIFEVEETILSVLGIVLGYKTYMQIRSSKSN